MTLPRLLAGAAVVLGGMTMASGCAEAPFDPVVEGPRIFAIQCARCHGSDGRGNDRGPDLVWGISDITEQDVVDVVLEGTPDMDPIDLTMEEAEAVAIYVVDVLRAQVQ